MHVMNKHFGSLESGSDTTVGNDADTYGWDTVFALNFTHANQAIVTG